MWGRLSLAGQLVLFEQIARLVPPDVATTDSQQEAVSWIVSCDEDGHGRTKEGFEAWRRTVRPDAPSAVWMKATFGTWTKLRQAAFGTVPDHRRCRVLINPRLTEEQSLGLMARFAAEHPDGPLDSTDWRPWALGLQDDLVDGEVRIPLTVEVVVRRAGCDSWEDACMQVGRSPARSGKGFAPVSWPDVHEAIRAYRQQHGLAPSGLQYRKWVGGENRRRHGELGLAKFPTLNRIAAQRDYPGWPKLLVDAGALAADAQHLIRTGAHKSEAEYLALAVFYLDALTVDPDTGLLWVGVDSLAKARKEFEEQTGQVGPAPSSYRKHYGTIANAMQQLMGAHNGHFREDLHPADIVSHERGGY